LSRFLFAPFLCAVLAAGTNAADKGQLDFSPSLFTVMAAINASGYEINAGSPNNDPLREQIRQAVAASKAPVLVELKQFYEGHRQRDASADLGQYISFALSTTGPPEFTFRYKPTEVPPDAQTLEGLGPLLVRFYREANIAELWNRSQPAFERALERYHAPVSRSILEVNAYLRNPTSGYLGRTFQIYLDLLGPPNQVQTRSYGNEYFVVVTPSADPRIDDIRHAYLHYLLDPLATKYGEEVLESKSLIDYAQGAPALEEIYKSDYLLLTTDSLIKAIEARLPGHAESVDEALREGYILAPYFAEKLTVYEKQKEAMRLFFPEMVKQLDVGHESKRLAGVQFAAEKRVRAARVVEAQPRVEAPVLKTLEQAERHYGNRDYERARQAYLQALEQTGEKPLHARAYYGLARIAVLKNDAETGEQLFRKALESTPDPYVAAWAHVYLGRLSDIAGNRDEATHHYQLALAIDGASAAARQAAAKGIHQTFKKEN